MLNRIRERIGLVRYRPASKDELIEEINQYLNGNRRRGNLNGWDVSLIDDMSYIFRGRNTFDENISDWDVSNVTNMEGMFEGCNLFRSSNVSRWNVSNVINMSKMFKGCINFNQPLNSWNVSNVTNMEEMFMMENYGLFNQPLDRWNVSNVMSMTRMFQNCTTLNQPFLSWTFNENVVLTSIFDGCNQMRQQLRTMTHINGIIRARQIEENRLAVERLAHAENRLAAERAERLARPPPVPDPVPDNQRDMRNAVRGIAMNVHNVASKINYPKLIDLLSSYLGENGANLNYRSTIPNLLNDIFNSSLVRDDAQIREGLDRLIERLRNIAYSNLHRTPEHSEELAKSAYLSLSYVMGQSERFKTAYVENVITDCVNAYNSTTNGMSCGKGIVERIVSYLGNACQFELSAQGEINDGEETKDDMSNILSGEKQDQYTNIISIISGNKREMIKEFIQDWYKSHRNGVNFSSANEDDRRQDLKNLLIRQFPNEDALIEEMMVMYGDSIGYEDDSFTYGGRRRKRRNKTRKSNKTRNKNKNKYGKRKHSNKKSKKRRKYKTMKKRR